jgi:hypothetical protein
MSRGLVLGPAAVRRAIETGLDADVTACPPNAYLRSSSGFGTLIETIRAREHSGKRVRLQAWIISKDRCRLDRSVDARRQGPHSTPWRVARSTTGFRRPPGDVVSALIECAANCMSQSADFCPRQNFLLRSISTSANRHLPPAHAGLAHGQSVRCGLSRKCSAAPKRSRPRVKGFRRIRRNLLAWGFWLYNPSMSRCFCSAAAAVQARPIHWASLKVCL